MDNLAEKNEPETGISEELNSEIDAGVENIMTNIETEEGVVDGDPALDDTKVENQDGNAPDEIKPDDVQVDDVKPDEIKTDDDKLDKEEPAPIPDELLTRAVKAGMSLTDALDFQDAEALERNLSLFGGEAKPKDDSTDDSDVDPFDSIPDLDPEEYDENIVNGFKTMKDIIRSQQAKIDGLNMKGEESLSSLFDKRVDGLSDSYLDAVGRGKLNSGSPQAVKREALRNMCDILESGYKAKGQEISSNEVFEQAVGVILSAETQAETIKVKGDKLNKRENLHTVRPDGKKTKVKMDALDEVAQELDDKYFKK